jgi:hypothetical protein
MKSVKAVRRAADGFYSISFGAKRSVETEKNKNICARLCRLLTANPPTDSMDACTPTPNPNPRWTMDYGSLRLAFAHPHFFRFHRHLPFCCVPGRTLMLAERVDHDRGTILEPDPLASLSV